MSPDSTVKLGEGVRVIIADDNRDTVMTLGILLRSEGFHVELVHGGREAVDAVRRIRPHALLLDLGMPDVSGHDVALQLRREYGDSCPVLIAVTARTGEGEKLLARSNGFQHYVAKPYDPDQLLGLLARLGEPGKYSPHPGSP